MQVLWIITVAVATATAARHHGPRAGRPTNHFRGIKALAEPPPPLEPGGRAYLHEVHVAATPDGQGATTLAYNASVKPGLWLVDDDEDVLAIECDPISMDLVLSVADAERAKHKALTSTFLIGSHRWGCTDPFARQPKRPAPFYR